MFNKKTLFSYNNPRLLSLILVCSSYLILCSYKSSATLTENNSLSTRNYDLNSDHYKKISSKYHLNLGIGSTYRGRPYYADGIYPYIHYLDENTIDDENTSNKYQDVNQKSSKDKPYPSVSSEKQKSSKYDDYSEQQYPTYDDYSQQKSSNYNDYPQQESSNYNDYSQQESSNYNDYSQQESSNYNDYSQQQLEPSNYDDYYQQQQRVNDPNTTSAESEPANDHPNATSAESEDPLEDEKRELNEAHKNANGTRSYRGKNHDNIDYSFWKKYSVSPNDACNDLVNNPENAANPYLAVHNIARCRMGVNQPLRYNKKLEEEAVNMGFGFIEYFHDYYNNDVLKNIRIKPINYSTVYNQYYVNTYLQDKYNTKNLRLEIINHDKLIKQFIQNVLHGNPHSPIPYYGPYSNPRTNKEADFSHEFGLGTGQCVTFTSYYNNLKDGGELIVSDSTKEVSIENAISSVSTLNKVKPDYPIYPQYTQKNHKNVIGGAAGKTLEEAYPKSFMPFLYGKVDYDHDPITVSDITYFFLNKHYFGEPSVDDIKKVTLSYDEMAAANMYESFYTNELSALQKAYGGSFQQTYDALHKHKLSDINKQFFNKVGLFDTTGFGIIGHLTQVIWGSSTDVGCGCASKYGVNMCTCSYFPAGNYSHMIVVDDTQVDDIVNMSGYYNPKTIQILRDAQFNRNQNPSSLQYFYNFYRNKVNNINSGNYVEV